MLFSFMSMYPVVGLALALTVPRVSSMETQSIVKPRLQAREALQLPGYPSADEQLQYEYDLMKVNWTDVSNDLAVLLKDSKDWWPADYGTYGPLMMRLSWHACGSYRTSDGRGGCEGGGIRLDPERSWPDNTNLDKARWLLEPIKLKYGNGVSWGDLFALVGTVAIKEMGGPEIGFCAGRLDVTDNVQTLPLGPSIEQEKFAPCPVNGECPFPLGSNTLGLIYVNPGGPMGKTNITGAAATVREVFGRMGWSGRELVALIGGGHTFGKAHGASQASNGVPPNVCPFASWDGPTGTDAITSGFEGPWTDNPVKWGNDYFRYLAEFEWEAHTGPGGNVQWRIIVNDTNADDIPRAPTANPMEIDKKQDVMMLTTDIAMKFDPEYSQYINEFAANETAFGEAFAAAWYKLVTRDMGPITRCFGPLTPRQSFQDSLPAPPQQMASVSDVRRSLRRLMRSMPTPSEDMFIRLAYQCASTYRATDYSGGCNGARIRFPPGSTWPINSGLNDTIALLEPIKQMFGEQLSYADLIVLAGNTAAERVGSAGLRFCPGRSDAMNGDAWESISYGNTMAPETIDQMVELLHRRGQTYKDFVALTFTKFRSAEKLRMALDAATTGRDDATCDTSGKDLTILALQHHPEIRFWAESFAAAGTGEYSREFARSWTHLMNADRFDGPVRNMCFDGF